MRSAKTALCELLFASTCLSLQYLGILHHGMEGAIKFSFLFLQDLKDYMRQAGEVTFTQCHRDRIGEGLVELVLIWISLLVVVVVKFAVKEDLTSNTVLVQKPCGFFLQFCWQSKWIIFFRVVEFASFNDMQRALKRLDGTELLGKRLRLTEVRVFPNLQCHIVFISWEQRECTLPWNTPCAAGSCYV